MPHILNALPVTSSACRARHPGQHPSPGKRPASRPRQSAAGACTPPAKAWQQSAVSRRDGDLILARLLRRWRSLPRRVAVRAFREASPLFDRAGIHVLPKSYYSSIPDFAWLRANERLWRRPVKIHGVDWNLDEQMRWLATVCGTYAGEVRDPWYEELHAARLGQGFGPLDAMILHCFVRHMRPQRIVEVGGGESTGVMVAASRLNEQQGSPAARITSVEPYPSPQLLGLKGVDVVREFAQAVPTTVFEQLAPGDFLFIDSSHTVKTGSEVLRLLLEIVPGLVPGVHVHVHDIVLPFLFTRRFGSNTYDWQESSLLLALLINNSRLRMRFCGSAVEHDRAADIRRLFASYRPRRIDRGLWDPYDRGGHWLLSAYLETE